MLQGNASDPSIWTALSLVVFDILHKIRFGYKLISSISKHLFTLVRFSYVNDFYLVQVGVNPVSVLASIKHLINSWGGV